MADTQRYQKPFLKITMLECFLFNPGKRVITDPFNITGLLSKMK